jgi:protein-tyrosine phosphatase
MSSSANERHERHIRLDGTRNLRDTGGYPAAPGRRTRWHTLLRSDELTVLPAHARDELRELGVCQFVDLRWPNELASSPNVFAGDPDIRYTSIPLLADDPSPEFGLDGMYRHVLDERWEQLGEVVRALLAPGGLPVVIGCAAGKDRTGVTIALLLALCGVPDPVIVADYAMSAETFAGSNETFPLSDWRRSLRFTVESPPEYMATTLVHLQREHGGARALLRSIGLTDAELNDLVDALTEPIEADGDAGRAGA